METNCNAPRWCRYIPNILTLSRIVCAPILLFWYLSQLYLWVILLYVCLVFSDFLDGYFARKFKAISTSPFRGYFDPIADFILILVMFGGFILNTVFPAWVILLIGGLFLQFLLTSGRHRPRYDPIGKYTGYFFFTVILIVLLFPVPLVYLVSLIGIIGFVVVSLGTRIFFLSKAKQN